MNETNLKAIGVTPLVNLLADFAKVFPVDDTTYAGNSTVSEADTKAVGDALVWMAKIGVQTVENYYPGTDDKNPVSK